MAFPSVLANQETDKNIQIATVIDSMLPLRIKSCVLNLVCIIQETSIVSFQWRQRTRSVFWGTVTPLTVHITPI